jgi:uncharacterized protein with FMN-binding domain
VIDVKRRRSVSILALIFVLAYGGYIFFFAPILRERQAIRNLQFEDVDLTQVPDGTYRGDFGEGNFAYAVEVTLSGHRIIEIEVVQNRDSEYAKRAEGVTGHVIEAQSVNVDVVTGATTTSKALLKAIESALWSAIDGSDKSN